MGVFICNDQGLAELLSGNRVSLPPRQVSAQRTVRFICKSCGSSEKRRHRMNSYCVDCAPRIPNMTFDFRANRWTNVSAVEGEKIRPGIEESAASKHGPAVMK